MEKAIERLHDDLMYMLTYHIKKGVIKELVEHPYGYLTGYYEGSISSICYLILIQHGMDEYTKAIKEYDMMIFGN